MKTKSRAYFLWLFGGILGAHHLYLERDNQAFVWFCTFGYFGIGWIRDLFRIPTYVSEANNDEHFQKWFRSQVKEKRFPPFSILRNTAAFALSFSWAHVFCSALPEDKIYGIDFNIFYHLVPFVVALGTWFVGNIGHQKGPLKHCLIAAYVLHPTLYVMNDYAIWMYAMTLASVMTFDSFSKTWRYTPKQKLSLSRRLLRFGALTLIYCALWSSSIYLKNESFSENQREMRFPEFVWNTLLGVKSDLEFLFDSIYNEGLWVTLDEIVDSFDPTGKSKAYRILGIPPGSTQSELTNQWRSLIREHHPDKVKGTEEDRKKAQDKFMLIQNAYNLLSVSRHRRFVNTKI